MYKALLLKEFCHKMYEMYSQFHLQTEKNRAKFDISIMVALINVFFHRRAL